MYDGIYTDPTRKLHQAMVTALDEGIDDFDLYLGVRFPRTFQLHAPCARRVLCSTECPRLSGSDWCLHSDVMINSRLQASATLPPL